MPEIENIINLNTNSLTFTNLKDSDEAKSFGISLGANLRSGTSSSASQGSSNNLKGNLSFGLSYSMHDYKQDTNATISNGTIKTGTTLNLDSNNNLISINGGVDYGSIEDINSQSGLNRNIALAQVMTKSLSVEPIELKYIYEIDSREDSSAKKERPTLWNDLRNNEEKQTLGGKTESIISNIAYGIATNLKIDAEKIGQQINPINAFSNITYGIATDIKNISNETNLDQKTINKVTDTIKYSPYLIATAPVVGAITVSDWIDKNNDKINPDTGEKIINPAPHLLTGLIKTNPADEPNVGRADDECIKNTLCKWTISSQSPQMQTLYYGFPGFKSGADIHDPATTNPDGSEANGVYKMITIPPYFIMNYYGSLGTYLKNSTKDYNKNKITDQQ